MAAPVEAMVKAVLYVPLPSAALFIVVKNFKPTPPILASLIGSILAPPTTVVLKNSIPPVNNELVKLEIICIPLVEFVPLFVVNTPVNLPVPLTSNV